MVRSTNLVVTLRLKLPEIGTRWLFLRALSGADFRPLF
jgi:hypothetical protein